ncbi:MAG TPA: hypothetical protein VHO67_02925 [Polyangia bacterium]|nr:hypothetical protein [Polyangia bacterium]
MSLRPWLWPAFGASLVVGCGGHPAVPDQPTWADVQPILRGNCAGCHGSTAAQTGLGYRLDFYDMLPADCGDAAVAIPGGSALAAAFAPKIADDITPPAGGRERMPPLPAASLDGWERDTLLRWTKQPLKGPTPAGNRPPTIQVFGLPAQVNNELTFTALVTDPDGDEAVGVIDVGGVKVVMDRSGSFKADVSMAGAPAGRYPVNVVTCDGWTSNAYSLGWVDVKH